MSDPKHVGEILLVEDNPGDVRLTKEMFRNAGLDGSFHVATDGVEALDFLHQRGDYADAPRPDVVFLDWHFPEKSGEEVLTEIKTDERLESIPVIVLTGSQPELDAIRSRNLRADGYAAKPISPDELRSTVDEL